MEQKYNNEDVIEIDVLELLGVIMQRFWIIAVSTIGLALAAFLISIYVLTPMYDSVTKIYIINRQSSESLTYSDLQSGTQLTKDYKALVTSRPVIEGVISELGLDYTVDELVDKITVDIPTDTRIVSIMVTNPDPVKARDIANAIRVSASAHIEAVMNTEAVNVVEDANLPTEPSSPNVIKNTAIGGMAGLLLAAAIIVIIYIMDDSIKNPEDVENYLHLSVLGSIPDMEAAAKNNKKEKKKKKSPDEETKRDMMYRADAKQKAEQEIRNSDRRKLAEERRNASRRLDHLGESSKSVKSDETTNPFMEYDSKMKASEGNGRK